MSFDAQDRAEAMRVARIAYNVAQQLSTQAATAAAEHFAVLLHGDIEQLAELGREDRQIAAVVMAVMVKVNEAIRDLDPTMEGRIAGAITWEIAQAIAEIALTAGASKIATGGGKFAGVLAKLRNFAGIGAKIAESADTPADAAKITAVVAEIVELGDESGELGRVIGKIDEVAEAEGFIGPTIGRSGYRTMAEFDAAVGAKYQGLVDQGYALTMKRVSQGLVKNDPMVIGTEVDSFARMGMRDWLLNVEGIQEGAGQIIQVNRRLYDMAGSGAYRIPDLYIPGARSIYDATIAEKTIHLAQTIDFHTFSGGANVTITRPSTLVTTNAQGSYGLRFP